MAVRPFEGTTGTVWVYRDDREETIFLLLGEVRQGAPGQSDMWRFRNYLDLITGEFGWFMDGSHFDSRSTPFE